MDNTITLKSIWQIISVKRNKKKWPHTRLSVYEQMKNRSLLFVTYIIAKLFYETIYPNKCKSYVKECTNKIQETCYDCYCNVYFYRHTTSTINNKIYKYKSNRYIQLSQ